MSTSSIRGARNSAESSLEDINALLRDQNFNTKVAPLGVARAAFAASRIAYQLLSVIGEDEIPLEWPNTLGREGTIGAIQGLIAEITREIEKLDHKDS